MPAPGAGKNDGHCAAFFSPLFALQRRGQTRSGSRCTYRCQLVDGINPSSDFGRTRASSARILQPTERGRIAGYAILLLLARLGLRAGEIVAIKLEDIDWHNGILNVHGKGGRNAPCRFRPMWARRSPTTSRRGDRAVQAALCSCAALRRSVSFRGRKPLDLSLRTRWHEPVLIRRTRVRINSGIDWPAIYCDRVLPWRRLARYCAIADQKQLRFMRKSTSPLCVHWACLGR